MFHSYSILNPNFPTPSTFPSYLLISTCLINDSSLIAYLNFFVYERAELSSISLKCTKVKLSILNSFDIEDH